MRIENNGTRYFGFQELSQSFGLNNSETQDSTKQKEKFSAKHKCRACGEPLSWVTGNVMVCRNPSCNGIKRERKDREGNQIVNYGASYEILDDKGAYIAEKIFFD